MNKDKKILIAVTAVILVGAMLYDAVHGKAISGPFDAMLKLAMLPTGFALGWVLQRTFTNKDK